MNEMRLFHALLAIWFVLSAVVFLYLLFVPAPYGRHRRAGWGPSLGARAGWVLMEFPAVGAFLLFFLIGLRGVGLVTLVFFAMWMTHYVYRTFVFPFRLSPGGRPVPLVVVGMGFFFNIVNAYLNGRWLFSLAPHYALSWLVGPRFLLGAALFFAGFAIHRRADAMLIALRANGQTGYQIPRGFLYKRISCPNYFGEMLEWFGWTVATWSPGALAFFIWTVANLLPRALSNHRWYKQTFADYPPERKAVLPYLL